MNTTHLSSGRRWWQSPPERGEVAWIALTLLWTLVLALAVPRGPATGSSGRMLRTTPQAYMAKVQAMVQAHGVRTGRRTDAPVVRPPPGGDVYLVAQAWRWWPVVELERGRRYRLHLSSMDRLHGFSSPQLGVDVQVLPGYERVLEITPRTTGVIPVACSEYCGAGHHAMRGGIRVVDGGARAAGVSPREGS